MPRHKDGDISKDGSLICFIKILYAKVIRAQYFYLCNGVMVLVQGQFG